MPYHSRSARAIAKRSKRKFFITLILIGFLIYATFYWLLPGVISGVFSVNNLSKTPKKQEKLEITNSNLAPPTISSSFEATNSANVIVNGFAAGNTKVKIFFDDALVDTITSSPDGSFSTKQLRLNLGANNIYGRSIDDEGKESLASKTYQLTYDNTKPELVLLDPKLDETTAREDQGRLFIKAKTEPDAKAYINDGQQIVGSNNEFQTFIPLRDGDNTIKIKAVDPAGNVSEITKTLSYTKPSPSPSPN